MGLPEDQDILGQKDGEFLWIIQMKRIEQAIPPIIAVSARLFTDEPSQPIFSDYAECYYECEYDSPNAEQPRQEVSENRQ